MERRPCRLPMRPPPTWRPLGAVPVAARFVGRPDVRDRGCALRVRPFGVDAAAIARGHPWVDTEVSEPTQARDSVPGLAAEATAPRMAAGRLCRHVRDGEAVRCSATRPCALTPRTAVSGAAARPAGGASPVHAAPTTASHVRRGGHRTTLSEHTAPTTGRGPPATTLSEHTAPTIGRGPPGTTFSEHAAPTTGVTGPAPAGITQSGSMLLLLADRRMPPSCRRHPRAHGCTGIVQIRRRWASPLASAGSAQMPEFIRSLVLPKPDASKRHNNLVCGIVKQKLRCLHFWLCSATL
jgi:hypothetical protein